MQAQKLVPSLAFIHIVANITLFHFHSNSVPNVPNSISPEWVETAKNRLGVFINGCIKATFLGEGVDHFIYQF